MQQEQSEVQQAPRAKVGRRTDGENALLALLGASYCSTRAQDLLRKYTRVWGFGWTDRLNCTGGSLLFHKIGSEIRRTPPMLLHVIARDQLWSRVE